MDQTCLVARLNMGGRPSSVEDHDEVRKVTRAVFEIFGSVPVKKRAEGE